MKFAEFCDTTTSYIGHIETGRKFPSMEMIEKMAKVLRVEPYHLFRNHAESNGDSDIEKAYPLMPKIMKDEIKSQIESSINEIFSKY